MALSADQLFVLFEHPAEFTADEVATFNALPIPGEHGDDDADLAAVGPWLVTIGIAGPPPRLRLLSLRLAGAARRVAAREAARG